MRIPCSRIQVIEVYRYNHFFLHTLHNRFHIGIQEIWFWKIGSYLNNDFKAKEYHRIKGLFFFVESLIITCVQCFLNGCNCSNEVLFILVYDHLTVDGHGEL